ncbi:MAG TPA: HAMP domain-containing sensor histidine kinase [Burkholderiaceae bacterium]|nr:HAMP domain-containing sensor histidine kinase [Burkholderiaceae bacterium]
MKLSTKIWSLPIGVGLAFSLSLALNLTLSSRGAAHLETVRSIDNPYLENMLRVQRGVEDLHTALQSAIAEGDVDKLKDAKVASASVRELLAGMRRLEAKAAPTAALAIAFDNYEATATAATRALLAHEEPGERVTLMQAAQQTLSRNVGELLDGARARLDRRFSSVAQAQGLNQWVSTLSALLVLAGLAIGSRLIIGSVWRELQAVHNQLLAAARLAGMAEIATNVLHNVGNVLNSVNVSAGLVGTRLRTSKLKGLARAVQLMDAHPDDLGEFLAHDIRGKQLPGYLRELARALEDEHAAMAEELGVLDRSIDHIKEIVATQQSYAGAPQVVESLRFEDLLDDALRMSAGALTRHKVDVVKDIEELPPLPLDRHRLLQILVNLISNAKHAMNDAPGQSPRITLGAALVEVADRRALRITVADNGEGITPENLTRVFAHGFTTRENGHGFGLHSCVLAAQEMGGTLTACSDGLGRGATFVLEVPIDNPRDPQ